MTSQLVQVLTRLVLFTVLSEEFTENALCRSEGTFPVLLVGFVRLVLFNCFRVMFEADLAQNAHQKFVHVVVEGRWCLGVFRVVLIGCCPGLCNQNTNYLIYLCVTKDTIVLQRSVILKSEDLFITHYSYSAWLFPPPLLRLVHFDRDIITAFFIYVCCQCKELYVRELWFYGTVPLKCRISRDPSEVNLLLHIISFTSLRGRLNNPTGKGVFTQHCWWKVIFSVRAYILNLSWYYLWIHLWTKVVLCLPKLGSSLNITKNGS